MEPRKSSETEPPKPRYRPDELIVAEEALDSVKRALEDAEITIEPIERVGRHRRVLLRTTRPHFEEEDLVKEALKALTDRGVDAKSVAEPNYIYGCPQMRGGQFVLPDPLPTADVAFRPSPIGAGVRVLVLDTEYYPLDPLHDVVPVPPVVPPIAEEPPGSGELAPAAGHGGFVLGQIARAAPGVEILPPIAVLDRLGNTDDFTLASALNAIDLNNDPPHIVNLSLGGYTLTGRLSQVLRDALQRLVDAGVVIVAAAGNHDSDLPFQPAATRDLTVSVGAVVRVAADWARSAYSNYGDWVDFSAPGQVTGPYLVWAQQPQPYGGWARWAGTSFATPLVVGALAALMSFQNPKDPQAAVAALFNQSPGAPPDFPNAKVVKSPVLWPD